METQPSGDALFLPFMQIPTGHHHVADAVIEELHRSMMQINCDKVDILSYSYGRIERIVSATYLNWIKVMPKGYDLLYHRLAVKNQSKRTRQLLYEAMFIHFFKRLMKENDPRIVFCTHCLPSNMASVLKEKGKLQAITVNVYTDYFINRVWGIRGIDYHLVPSIRVKEFLLELGVETEKIFVTGIPIHPVFQSTTQKIRRNQLHVLVTGGSLGVGSIEHIIPDNPSIHYSVLCGHNHKLYQKLKTWGHPLVHPIQYVSQKEEIKALYNEVDAVITKPGGVTISECLKMQIPIFTCHALPGQEKINETELNELGVINVLDPLRDVEQQVKGFFKSKQKQETYYKHITSYHQYLDKKPLSDILLEIYHPS